MTSVDASEVVGVDSPHPKRATVARKRDGARTARTMSAAARDGNRHGCSEMPAAAVKPDESSLEATICT